MAGADEKARREAARRSEMLELDKNRIFNLSIFVMAAIF
jgi:hypothetical protein